MNERLNTISLSAEITEIMPKSEHAAANYLKVIASLPGGQASFIIRHIPDESLPPLAIGDKIAIFNGLLYYSQEFKGFGIYVDPEKNGCMYITPINKGVISADNL